MTDLEQLKKDAAAVFYASDIYQQNYWGKWTGPDRFVSEAAYIAQAAEIARLRAALAQIAGCQLGHRVDVVGLASAALGEQGDD